MTLPDFLIHQPDDEIVLAGHRITIVNILDYYEEGYSAEMLAARFPSVPLALIHKVIAFYLENRDQLDQYLAKYRSDLAAARAKGRKTPSAAELRARLDVMSRTPVAAES